MSDDADLPKALVKKIAKSKLAAIDQENGVEVKDVQISKDALLALSESARVFIHYLTATGEKIRLSLWHMRHYSYRVWYMRFLISEHFAIMAESESAYLRIAKLWSRSNAVRCLG